MTTFSAPRITIDLPPEICGNEAALTHIVDGLVAAEMATEKDVMRPLWNEEKGDYDESVEGWNTLVLEAANEIKGEVGQLLEDAIIDRLPWTNGGTTPE